MGLEPESVKLASSVSASVSKIGLASVHNRFRGGLAALVVFLFLRLTPTNGLLAPLGFAGGALLVTLRFRAGLEEEAFAEAFWAAVIVVFFGPLLAGWAFVFCRLFGLAFVAVGGFVLAALAGPSRNEV